MMTADDDERKSGANYYDYLILGAARSSASKLHGAENERQDVWGKYVVNCELFAH